MNGRDRFLAACVNRPVDRPPVWLMRQAGRYLPEYRGIRSQHSFWEMLTTPDLVTEITLQPIRRFGMDAAILFSDILIVLEVLGLVVDYQSGGPAVHPKIQQRSDLAQLRDTASASPFTYIKESLVRLTETLHPTTAVIGFAGAPFTLAAYCVEEGPSHQIAQIKTLAATNHLLYQELLDRISDQIIELLVVQIEAGADAVQIFDTWSERLSAREYREHALPYTQRIIRQISQFNVPVILYIRNAATHLEAAASSGCTVLSIDSSISLSEARKRLGAQVPLQGNLDPSVLSRPDAEIRNQVHEMIAATRGVGHIVNLGQGLGPDSPVRGVTAFVRAVKEWSL
jgi:uroporphyrinogen decarboxylase